jgi:hypothetical protein
MVPFSFRSTEINSKLPKYSFSAQGHIDFLDPATFTGVAFAGHSKQKVPSWDLT